MKKITVDVLINSANSAKNIKDLTQSVDDLKKAAEGLDVTSDEFRKISQEAVKADGRLQQMNKSFEGLDPDAKAGEIGKLAGGLSALGAAASLAFAGNKDAEEFFKTFAQGVAVTNAAKGAIETYTSSQKLLQDSYNKGGLAAKGAAAAQAAYSAVVGTSTGALKLFRIALAATGIGAIVLALVALITNFKEISEWVTKTINRFEFLQKAVAPLVLAFNLVKEGLQNLGIIDDEVTAKAKANVESRIKNAQDEKKAVGDKYDYEIAKAKAAGENTFDLEQRKRQAAIDTNMREVKLLVQKAKLDGELTEEMKERLLALKDETIKIAQEMTVARIAEERTVADESAKVNTKAAEDKKAKEAEATELAEKNAADEAKAKADTINKIIELENAAEDAKLSQIEREKNAVYDKYFSLIEAAEKFGQDTAAIEAAQQAELNAINEKKLAADAAFAEAKLQADLEAKQARIDAGLNDPNATPDEIRAAFEAQQALDLELFEIEKEKFKGNEEELARIEKEYADKTVKNAGDEAAALEGITKAKIQAAVDLANTVIGIGNTLNAAAGDNVEVQKALGIASIMISSAEAVAEGISAVKHVPFPANIPAIVTSVGAVLANIMKAKSLMSKVKVPGKGGGANIPLPGAGGGSASAPSVSPQTLFPTQDLQGETPESMGDGTAGLRQNVIKAIVVERDITNTQNNMRGIEERATIG